MKMKIGLLSLCLMSYAPLHADEVEVVDSSNNYALSDAQDEAFIPEKPIKQVEQASPGWEEPLSQVDEPVASSQDEKASLLAKISTLQQEIQELRGLLEVQAHDLKLLQQQQLAFYKDLDGRLSKEETPAKAPSLSLDGVEPATAPNPLPPAKPQAAATNPADEQLSYVTAYDFIKKKQFDKAHDAMQRFVDKYPSSHYAPNAHYWLGELFLLKRQYLFASKEFQRVLKDYPRSTKVAASMLKLAYAYANMGNLGEAKKQLTQVIQQFPDTSTAQLAKSKLSVLNEA